MQNSGRRRKTKIDLTGVRIWGNLGAEKKATGILYHRWRRLYGIIFVEIGF